MIDAVDVVVALVWSGLIGAYVLRIRSAARANSLQAAGIAHQSCARCGCGLSPAEEEEAARMCRTCVAKVRRHYNAAAWLFGGLAAFFVAMTPFIVVSEYHRFGPSTALRDALLLLGVAAMTGVPAWGLRIAARTLK